MSLKTVYNDTNKRVNSKLAIRYTVDPSDNGAYYTVTRTATMSYAYIGMDEETANQCAAAKVAQYSRNYSRLKTVEGSTVPQAVQVRECKTGISVTHQNGIAWNVEIQVNETDVKASISAPLDPATLFATENARNYDGGVVADALTITGAARSTVVGHENELRIDFTQDIRDFAWNRVSVQFKETESGAWTSVGVSNGGLSGANGWVMVLNTTAIIVRIFYGSIESPSFYVEA